MLTSRGSSCLRLLLMCLMLSPLLGTLEVAHADEATEFRSHYEQAMKLYESGRCQDSLNEFQAAHAIKQLPELLLNLGQAHRRLGHAKESSAPQRPPLWLSRRSLPKASIGRRLCTSGRGSGGGWER